MKLYRLVFLISSKLELKKAKEVVLEIQSLIKKDLVSRGKFNGRQRVLHCNVVTAKRKNKIKRI